MPFKDPTQRRQYHRRYKREWRKRRAHPLAAFRAYVCPRFPGLRVGRGYFDGGFLITDQPDIQAEVERHPQYGKFIFPLALDLTTSSQEEDAEDE